MNNGLLARLAAGAVVLILGGCSETGGKAADAPAVERLDYLRGMYAYTDFCSGCHDAGQGGAPILDSEDWNGRARAFPALLRDHRSKGWLGTPAKGAHAELSEGSVAAAVGYMLAGGGED
jgi:cytochrome c5